MSKVSSISPQNVHFTASNKKKPTKTGKILGGAGGLILARPVHKLYEFKVFPKMFKEAKPYAELAKKVKIWDFSKKNLKLCDASVKAWNKIPKVARFTSGLSHVAISLGAIYFGIKIGSKIQSMLQKK